MEPGSNRFSLCSLCSSQAIHVVGAEQFSEYIGYAGSLSFAGRHNDAHMERDLDGSLSCLACRLHSVEQLGQRDKRSLGLGSFR
eukprot:4766580-Amphidinium_carterae.1